MLLGVWDAPELAPHRALMVGQPITRPERTTNPVPLSNCSWVWECGFRNWGLMQGHMKIEAREWHDEFHCFDLLADPQELEYRARRVVELAALSLQASLLVRHAPHEVADAFCGSRLGGEGGRAYGTLPTGVDCAAIVERHRPRLAA